jgi:parallel beta-helix repeat protein
MVGATMKSLFTTLMVTSILAATWIAAFDIQLVRASGTIYIRADGSIDPPTANVILTDNVTYTFTDDNYASIVVERNGIVVDGAGYWLMGSGADDSRGIDLAGRRNVTVHNTFIGGFDFGVFLLNSSYSTIDNNTIMSTIDGIWLSSSSNIHVTGNTLIANGFSGILLLESPNNCVSDNKVTNNQYGIFLWSSSNSSISGNTIAATNMVGLDLGISSGNRIYHNNFIDNGQDVSVSTGYTNVWHDGYPSGGNYWSNYTDVDLHKGLNQSETGDDGVWDQPYIIDTANMDKYPLTKPLDEPAGDVDGDNDVDVYDIVNMASVYGSEYPEAEYRRNCDMDLDGDIDIFDIVLAVANYGKSWS